MAKRLLYYKRLVQSQHGICAIDIFVDGTYLSLAVYHNGGSDSLVKSVVII